MECKKKTALKAEGKSMLELMDQVLVGVKRPRPGKDRSKYKPKKKIQKVETNDNADSRPIVE